MNREKNITQMMARQYIAQGFSVIPANKDKTPALSRWKPYQKRQMAEPEICRHFPSERIAIITGYMNLEVIDVDTKNDPSGSLWRELWQLIQDNLPDVAPRLVVVNTVSGGKHIYYRCPKPDPSKKLANGTNGVLIETRGTGGYVIAPPSPGYTFHQGTPENIPEITAEEHQTILAVCRSFDEVPPQPTPQPTLKGKNTPPVKYEGLSPFEDYDSRGDVIGLLERHGWKQVKQAGDRIHFQRPGETTAPTSANFHTGKNRFYCFTTSSQFEAGKAHSPTAVFSLLECKNDLSEASRRLYADGYGDRRKEPENSIDHSLLPPDEVVDFVTDEKPDPVPDPIPTRETRHLPEPVPDPKATPAEIARKLAETELYAATGEGLKIYSNGIWEPVGTLSDTSLYILNSFGNKASRYKREETISLLSQFTRLKDGHDWNHHTITGWIPLQDQELNYNTFETRPLQKDSYWTYRINAAYKSDLRPDLWLNFLNSTFDRDPDKEGKIKSIRQFFGLCLTPDISYQKAMLFTGTGANGKGIIHYVLFEILKDASVYISLPDLSNPNKAVNLISKTIAGDPDLTKGTFDDGIFKKVVAGEPIPAKLLYNDSFNIAPIAKLLFCANSLPITKDVSAGYFRRWIIIDFPNIFDPAKNRDLKYNLLKEKDAIFSWMVNGLRELKQEGQLFIPESHYRELNQYKNEASSISAFISEKLEKSENSMEPASTVYNSYTVFCAAEGFRHPLGKIKFNKELCTNTGATTEYFGARQLHFVGIRFSDPGTGSPF